MNAKLVDKNGVKAVEINGEVIEFVAYRTWRPYENNIKNVGESGIQIMSLLCSGIINRLKTPYSIYGEYWLGDGIYDWDVLRKDIDLYIKNSPNTYLAINLMLDTRDWFLKEHPECPNSFIYFSAAICYTPWRECASRMLRDTLDFLEREYPEKVFAIILSAGGTCEWHNKKVDILPTDSNRKTFQEWTGNPDIQLPTNQELEDCSDGSFRNVFSDKKSIYYLQFINELITKELAYYAKLVKEHTKGRLLVGAPAGYIMSGAAATYGRTDAYERVQIPELDILITPASYTHRALDGVSSSQTALDSIRLNNKLMIHSIDNYTFKGRDHLIIQLGEVQCKPDSMEESINYIRREAALAMSKGVSFWFFDQYGCNYPDKEDTEELGKIRKAFQKMCSQKVEYNAEVAFVVDSKGYNYVNTESTYILKDEHVNFQRDAMGRIGCPYDLISINDLLLENFPADKYKFMIIPDCFFPTKDICKAIKKLRDKGMNFLFLYAAGALTEQGFSYESLSDFCGIKIKESHDELYFTVVDKKYNVTGIDRAYGSVVGKTVKPELTSDDPEVEVWGKDYLSHIPRLVVKRREKGFDAWSARGTVPSSVLRKMAEEAGVYMYQDHGLPTYANSRMAAFYDHKGGERQITFPYKGKITEFYSGKEYISDGKPLNIVFHANECKLFIYE